MFKFRTRENEKEKQKTITPEEYIKKQQEMMKQFDMMQQKAFDFNKKVNEEKGHSR